jgi:GNAT superfamily N-acetyltransferase
VSLTAGYDENGWTAGPAPAYNPSMTSPRVRPAVVDDADAIARVHVRSWQVAYRGFMPDELLDSIDPAVRAGRERERLAQLPPGVAVFVAIDPTGQTVGFAQVGDYEEGDGSGQVYSIYVDPEHWGTGAGRALMAASLNFLTASGPRPVRLWALDGNERARRFYERCGFVADGAVGSHTVRGELEVPTIRFTLDPG